MDNPSALSLLARWLLGQNSFAARILGRYPTLLPLFHRIKPGRLPAPPRLEQDLDEEETTAAGRAWLAESQLSLMMAFLAGRIGPRELSRRLARLSGQAIRLCLESADLALRRRLAHPLMLPPNQGPGPVAVLDTGNLSGVEPGFNQTLSPLFLFTRQAGLTGAVGEDHDFLHSLGDRQPVILREYVLRLAQRTMEYLTLDHPLGPGLPLAPPRETDPGLIGPQIMSLSQFIHYYRHQAGDRHRFHLARLNILAGPSKLIKEINILIKETLLSAPWTTDRLARAWEQEPSDQAEAFDPLQGPGGLVDLGRLVDGAILLHGLMPGGDTHERLKKAAALGLLPADQSERLTAALESLLLGHLVLSLLGRNLPGHSLQTPADLDAALALWPRPPKKKPLPLAQAREAVAQAKTKLLRH